MGRALLPDKKGLQESALAVSNISNVAGTLCGCCVLALPTRNVVVCAKRHRKRDKKLKTIIWQP